MTTELTRRQILRLAALGGMSAVLAACAARTTEPANQAQAAPPPTPAPPTPVPATASPSPVPTVLPATSTPEPLASATAGSGNANGAAAPTAMSQSPAATEAPTAPMGALASSIARAANQFLASLNADALAKATYPFGDAERVRWHWTLPRGFPRNGLSLRDMSPDQRALALALLRASVSGAGYQKALDIMSLQRDLGNDPELYYVTLFGTPGAPEPWGWRFEGHHLSRHFTVVGEQVAATPFFNGAWPNLTDAGLRAMPREEDAARELVQSLDERARAVAIFQARTLTNHVTQNQPYVSPLDPVGIAAADLAADQQQLVLEIVQTYLGVLPESIGAPSFERIRAAGVEQIRFGWAGSTEPRRPQYYRLQGPTFLLEFDNSRNGGTHIHSVWRDFTGDFGQNLL